MESVVRGSLIGTVEREASFPKSRRTEEARKAGGGYGGETGTGVQERWKTGGEERRIKIGLLRGRGGSGTERKRRET